MNTNSRSAYKLSLGEAVGTEEMVADAVDEMLLKLLVIKMKNTLELRYRLGESTRGVGLGRSLGVRARGVGTASSKVKRRKLIFFWVRIWKKV